MQTIRTLLPTALFIAGSAALAQHPTQSLPL